MNSIINIPLKPTHNDNIKCFSFYFYSCLSQIGLHLFVRTEAQVAGARNLVKFKNHEAPLISRALNSSFGLVNNRSFSREFIAHKGRSFVVFKLSCTHFHPSFLSTTLSNQSNKSK